MVTWGISRTMAALVTATSVAVVISGCATPQTDAADVPSPSAETPSSTPSPTETLPPSPTPIPTSEPVTCDTLFTDEVYATWEVDGLTFRDEATLVDPKLQHHVDGGMTCKWVKPYTDNYAWYAQWRSDEAEWEALREELLSEGYTEISEPLPGMLEAPRDPEYKPALVYRDGVVRYANSARLLGSLRDVQ